MGNELACLCFYFCNLAHTLDWNHLSVCFCILINLFVIFLFCYTINHILLPFSAVRVGLHIVRDLMLGDIHLNLPVVLLIYTLGNPGMLICVMRRILWRIRVYLFRILVHKRNLQSQVIFSVLQLHQATLWPVFIHLLQTLFMYLLLIPDQLLILGLLSGRLELSVYVDSLLETR